MHRLTLLALIWIVLVSPLRGEDEPPVDSLLSPADSIMLAADTAYITARPDDTLSQLPRDTLLYNPGEALRGYLDVSDTLNTESHLRQKPMVALLKSMVIPGWGQLGNRRYIKAIIYAGLDAVFIVRAINYRNEARDFYDLYQAADSVGERNAYYADYENRRARRNKSTWFAVIVTFLATFDAYVDAHLSGFPTAGEDSAVRFDIEPDIDGGVNARLSWQF